MTVVIRDEATSAAQRHADVMALPEHRFHEVGPCPTCPHLPPPRDKKDKDKDKDPDRIEYGRHRCRMRCAGTVRGACGMPLREAEDISARRCAICQAETVAGQPLEPSVDMGGALRLAAAVIEEAQKQARWKEPHPGAVLFLETLGERPSIWSALIGVAASRARLNPSAMERHARF